MGKRGKNTKELNYTFKYINATEFLYVWEYDKEESDKKREQLKNDGCSWMEVSAKGSKYKWISKGKWDLKNPSPKLVAFLEDKSDDFIAKLQKEVENRRVERFKKRMQEKIPQGN